MAAKGYSVNAFSATKVCKITYLPVRNIQVDMYLSSCVYSVYMIKSNHSWSG